MQIVIDIDEDEYRCVQITGCIGNKTAVSNAIYHGILLPEHYGRLIDADYLKDVSLLHNWHGNNKNIVPYSDRKGYRLRNDEVLTAIINSKTIIPATKETSGCKGCVYEHKLDAECLFLINKP